MFQKIVACVALVIIAIVINLSALYAVVIRNFSSGKESGQQKGKKRETEW